MTMSEPFTPVSVEDAIRTAANRIAKGVGVWRNALEAHLTAERDYDHAYAAAYMDHPGAAHEKRYAAELATLGEREHRDTCHVTFKYADRQLKAIESELMAMQSINKSVKAAYNAVGVTER